MSELPVEELSSDVIKLRRKFPYLHRDQAWKMAIDEYERKLKQMKK